MKKNLAVIDTNILISALIGQTGYPRKIFEELILPGVIKMCVSVEVYAEYQEVLKRKKFSKYPNFTETAIALLEEIKRNSFWYEPMLKIDVLDDKDDNKFIELAFEANAEYIITGNSNDFIIKEYQGTIICSPKEFYDLQKTH